MLEQQREAAERKVHIVEENFHALQKRLKEALAQVQELGARLAVNEKAHDTHDGDLSATRDQIRDQAQRLHEAELEDNALRQRESYQERAAALARALAHADAEERRDRIRGRRHRMARAVHVSGPSGYRSAWRSSRAITTRWIWFVPS